MQDDARGCQPFGLGGADIIAPQHLEHRTARHAEHHRAEPDRDRAGRQREQDQMLDGVASERYIAARRRPTQALGEHQDRQGADHEHGHGQADTRYCRQGAVDDAAGAQGGGGAGRQAEQQRQQPAAPISSSVRGRRSISSLATAWSSCSEVPRSPWRGARDSRRIARAAAGRAQAARAARRPRRDRARRRPATAGAPRDRPGSDG